MPKGNSTSRRPNDARDERLAHYRSMRDFKITHEPSGSKPHNAAQNASLPFVIQKHAATRLHYDFRLGWNGVLKSWAVTKGPSYVPGDKRLAVQVEDHPWEYGDFEGIIPKGQYGGGTVMLWDRGTWEPHIDVEEGLRKGSLKFALHGEKMKGNWALVRMGGRAASNVQPNWLLIREHDDLERSAEDPAITDEAPNSVVTNRDLDAIARAGDSVWQSNREESGGAKAAKKAKIIPFTRRTAAHDWTPLMKNAPNEPLPAFIAPQLAGLAKSPPLGERWAHEIKLDGYRIQARIDREKSTVQLLTRTGLDWTHRMKALAESARTLPVKSALIDGEVVVLSENGTSSFADLQAAFEQGAEHELIYFAFGDQYGRVLAAGQIRIEQEDDRFQVRYFDQLFPLSPRSLSIVLARTAERARNDTLGFLADSLSRLPAPDSTAPVLVQDRHRDKDVIYRLLRQFCEENPQLGAAITATIDSINSDPDVLDDLLNQQNYRLAYWRTADQELGYRRFFDINNLIGMRMERPHVFEATHRRVFEWFDSGILNGIRVDHPDGLRDPKQYFARLRARTPQSWIIGEKILEPGEDLPETWPIDGTSGYDFMNLCNRVLVYGPGLEEFTAIYADFTGRRENYEDLAHGKKLNVEQEALGSDVNRLASLFVEICENHRDRRDYTRAEIRRAIREVAACFSI